MLDLVVVVVMTRMSISCDNWSTYWSRWSCRRRGRSIAGVARAASCVLRSAICCIAVVGGVDGVELSPTSAWLRSDWMSPRHAVELLRQRLRGIEHADPRRLAVRAGRQRLQRAVKLLNAVSSVPVPPGVP